MGNKIRTGISRVIMVGLAGGSLVAVASPAQAAVSCGSTVYENTTLTEDLICSSGDGLTLGTGISLDLGGHRIIGQANSGTALRLPGGNTIRNGTITGFANAIENGNQQEQYPKPTGAPINIREMTVESPVRTTSGVSVFQSVFNNAELVDLGGPEVSVSNSTFTKSHITHRLGGNTEVASATLLGSGVTHSGIYANGALGKLTIRDSLLDGATNPAGAAINAASAAEVYNVTVKNYQYGVALSDGEMVLKDSSFSDLSRGGISISDIYRGGSGRMEMTLNTFDRAGVAVNVGLQGSLTASGNHFRDGTTGVQAAEAYKVRLIGNTFSNNSDSGAKIDDYKYGSKTLMNNRALKNTNYGLYAPGANDQGGNTASGNGTDCVGVTCGTAAP